MIETAPTHGGEQTIRECAAAWVTRLNEDGADPVVAREFEAWRDADPRHADAFAEAAALWRSLAGTRDFANEPALQDALGRPLLGERIAAFMGPVVAGAKALADRPIAAGATTLAAIVLAFVFIVPSLQSVDRARPEHQTAVAEIRDIVLDDGSVVTLGAATGLDLAFTPQERRVTLGEGEAFFSVAKDESRPFLVHAGDMVVRVVGTQFDIRRSTEQVRVAVLEGVVEVHGLADDRHSVISPTDSAAQTLTAGEQIIAAATGAPLTVADIGGAPPGAWRSGRLSYDSVFLKEVVFDANRYFDGEIIIASDDIAELEVTTSFRVDQIDTMIGTMELILPIRADYRSDGRIILTAAPPNG